MRSDKRVAIQSGGRAKLSVAVGAGDPLLGITLDGPPGVYVRREIAIPLDEPKPARRD